MKKKCFSIIIIGYLFFLTMNSLSIKIENISKINNNLRNNIESSAFNPEEFNQLNYNYEDVIFPEKIYSKIIQELVPVSINIEYPILNDSWYIVLPTLFSDATNYFIQRSPYEIYHPLEETELSRTYTGHNSHWKFNYPTETDTLNFSIKAPIGIFERDIIQTTLNHKEYTITFSRFDNKYTYNQVIFIHQISKPFNVYTIQLFNQTGGLNENITDTSQYIFYDIVRNIGVDLYFEINVGTLFNNTDYEFRIIIDRGIVPPKFTDKWIANIFIPMITGFMSGFILVYIYFLLKENIRARDPRINRYAIPFGILGAFIGLIFMYISFIT